MERGTEKALIIGGKGFIGSNLSKALPWADILDLKDGQDIRTYNFSGKYDIIYHMGAKASIPNSFKNPIESHEVNVLGTLRVLEYARETGAKVVFSSSAAVYGDAPLPTPETYRGSPESPYGVQKLICEEYLKFYWKLGVKSVALRYFNVFGENQEIANDGQPLLALADFMGQKGTFKHWGNGNQRRDFVYVGDVVEANIKAGQWLETADRFQAFNIGSGTHYSVNEVLNMIDPKRNKESMGERREPKVCRADITKAELMLDWKPTRTLPEWIKHAK